MSVDKKPMSKEKRTKLYMTWDDFDFAVETLAKKIKDSEISSRPIYGVIKGGLVLAVALSHALGEKEWPVIMLSTPCQCLIVDDTADSGKTLKWSDLIYPDSIKVTIFCNLEKSEFIPDFYVWEQDDHNWIVFPWEQYGELL